jgi:hypothetical protein
MHADENNKSTRATELDQQGPAGLSRKSSKIGWSGVLTLFDWDAIGVYRRSSAFIGG